MKYKLGKLPARADSVQFKLRNYLNVNRLPTPPRRFGHASRFPGPWGMLGNDKVGDCVLAGGAHEEMLWHFSGKKKPAVFSDKAVISDYSAITGYDPRNPDSDTGTDMQEAAAYRKRTGLLSVDGKRHTIDAYAALKLRDIDELLLAMWLFDAVGVGIHYTQSADKQFDAQQPWDDVGRSKDLGGHYIPVFDVNSKGNLCCITWNRYHAMTPAYFNKYCDEAVAYISLDALDDKGISAEGFDRAALQADLNAL